MAVRNKTKRRTRAAAGSHVVEIEGPLLSLRDGVDSDCLLVPLVDVDHIKLQNESHLQQYSYMPKDLYTSFIKPTMELILGPSFLIISFDLKSSK